MVILKEIINTVLLSVLGIVISICIVIIIIFSLHTLDSIKLKYFHKHISDYQLIANKVIKLRDDGILTEEDNCFYVENGKTDEIPLTKAEKRSLLNIDKTFINSDYPLSMIRVYDDNFVIFLEADYFSFGVVYSEDKSKPQDFGGKNWNDTKYKVKTLTYQWYMVKKM